MSSAQSQVPFDGECDRCGCPRSWRSWGPCACGMCDSAPCTPVPAESIARVIREQMTP